MGNKKEIKANRSSIIRIIISNYNDIGIKEVKVRYNKQAQLDTFLVESQLEDGVFTLKDIKWKAKEKYRYDMIVGEKVNNSVKITKIDKFLKTKIREYIIKFDVSSKNSNIVVVSIKDCKLHAPVAKGERANTRRMISQTERKLLSKETQISYSKIACCQPKDIDSLKIYKIKRYLSYRSNMLLFFSLINDFLCEGISEEKKVLELCNITSGKNENIIEERVSEIAKYLKENVSKELKNYNDGIEKNIIKKRNSINDCNNKIKSCKQKLKKAKDNKKVKNFKRIIEESEKKIKEYNIIISEKEKEILVDLSEEKIKEDVYKILEIYSDLRHKLAHYNYTYFENLFENNVEDPNMESMAKLLDLNIFKCLELSKRLRIENKTNYLDDNTTFSILGEEVSAKKYYSFYNTLCEQKNGFNTFINSFFTEDGIEDTNFKEKVNIRFEEEIKELEKLEYKQKEKKFKDKELELLKEQKDKLGTAYIWDIHNSTEYKKFYNERKREVEKYNQTLNGNRDKKALNSHGEKLLKIKNDMESITKRNSIIRLKYKLQIAYVFLIEEFNGDIIKFKNEFDIAKVEKIEEYRACGEKYLNCKKKLKKEEFEKMLKELETTSEITWLSSNPENNLFKFYVLTYILLPLEFKGDFLGFVKKHYYDIKNVEYLDENSEALTNEQLEKMKDDSFFNKIRLFEKNSKKYNIFSKTFLDDRRVKEYFNKLNLGAKYFEYTVANGESKNIFNKNIIIPIFKYYQIVIKLYNDIEIATLLYLSKLKDMKIEEVIDTLESKPKIKHYKLSELFKFFEDVLIDEKKFNPTSKLEVKEEQKNVVKVRNSLQHLNYENLLQSIIELNTKLEPKKIDKNSYQLAIDLRETFNYIEKYLDKFNSVNLDYNFLNDYYMKKEQFIFGQIKQTDNIVANILETENKEEKSINKIKEVERERELLKICKLNSDSFKKNKINSINKLYETYEILRKIVEDKKIKKYEDIIDNRVNLSKFKNKKKINKIKDLILKDSSDILGLYKRKITELLKEKIINKLIYEEEKILYISTYEGTSKIKKIYKVRIMRDKSSENFYFYNQDEFNEKITTILLPIGNVVSLELKIFKSNLYILNKIEDKEIRTKEREIIDLRKHYCFKEEIKFKDLKI